MTTKNITSENLVISQANDYLKIANDFARCKIKFGDDSVKVKDATIPARILYYIIACVNDNDTPFQEYHIHAKSALKSLDGRSYRGLKSACRVLLRSSVEFQTENDEEFLGYSLFSKIHYHDGIVTARFDPGLKNFFLDLKELYTLCDVGELLRLSSEYSRRLYIFLCSYWRSYPTRTTPITDLYFALDVPKSLMNSYFNFKTRALEPAAEEINMKTDIKYEWKPLKINSRSYTHIEFKFLSAPPSNQTIIEQQTKIDREHIDFLQTFGFSYKVAERLAAAVYLAGKDVYALVSKILDNFEKSADKSNRAGYLRVALESECQIKLPMKEPSTTKEPVQQELPTLTDEEIQKNEKAFALHQEALDCYYYTNCEAANKASDCEKCNYCKNYIQTRKTFANQRLKKRYERNLQ